MSENLYWTGKRASWWSKVKHYWTCGGGWWSIDPETGEAQCNFCGWLFQEAGQRREFSP